MLVAVRVHVELPGDRVPVGELRKKRDDEGAEPCGEQRRVTEQRLRALHDVPQARHSEKRDEDDERRIRRPNRHEQTEGESQRDRRPRSWPLVYRQPQADDRRDEEERESVAEDRVVGGVVEQCGPEGDRDERHHDRRPREPPEQHEAELRKPDQREDETGSSGRDLIRRGEPVGRLARQTSRSVSEQEEREEHHRLADRILVEVAIVRRNATDARHSEVRASNERSAVRSIVTSSSNITAGR